MIEIAYSKEKEILRNTPQEVQETIEGILQILDSQYRADRNKYEDDGGYVIIVDKKEDFKELKNKAYVELSPEQLSNDYDRLQSITQIFPHEMGHVLYGITTRQNKNIDQNIVDVHYSNIVTEYSTAFNEGFGEHFEVISRSYENNKEIIRQIVEGMMPICSQNNLNIFFEAPDKEVNVNVDPMKMMRVFENIITNAIRYSDKEKSIKVKISAHKDGAIVTVENEGKSIKKEELDKIFDRFYRIDEARSSQTGGSGIGLSIAKSIVKLHNGEIWAECKENKVCFFVLINI